MVCFGGASKNWYSHDFHGLLATIPQEKGLKNGSLLPEKSRGGLNSLMDFA